MTTQHSFTNDSRNTISSVFVLFEKDSIKSIMDSKNGNVYVFKDDSNRIYYRHCNGIEKALQCQEFIKKDGCSDIFKNACGYCEASIENFKDGIGDWDY